jgi:Txe/YoeB family toxin of Txe-Axe toxin-antitoxin module
MRRVVWERYAQEDLFYWAKNDVKILKKIIELIEDTQKIRLVV